MVRFFGPRCIFKSQSSVDRVYESSQVWPMAESLTVRLLQIWSQWELF